MGMPYPTWLVPPLIISDADQFWNLNLTLNIDASSIVILEQVCPIN